MLALSVTPYLIVVSPIASEVSRSPPAFCSDQSAIPVSTCQCPLGTVQVAVALPGRSAQIGGGASAARAAALAAATAAMMILSPRIAHSLRSRRNVVEARNRDLLCASA